ncbi:MAG TPA: flagellin [Candidatus Kapabacteria bacterium]|nr:flagellin [Candidatus Kapabacteria bacterium]
MPQIINTNISSLNAQRNLNKSQGALQTSLQRLSSGLRINSAKDDAAGLAISNRFTTQVRGLNVATRNANDGISFAQTTESALDEITTSLQRIRDLAVQSANDTNSASDRKSLQSEVDQLVSEINRIAETTTFNGSKVANGSLKSLNFQIGANAGETVAVKGVDARASSLGSQPGAVQTTFDGGNAAAASQTALTIQVGSSANATSVDVMSTANGGTITSATAAQLTDTEDDNYGTGFAKSLAERINSLREDGVEGLEGVYASATTTFDYSDVAGTVAAEAYVGAGTLANGDLVINGVDIGPVEVQEKDANGALVTAINAKSDITGVKASLDDNSRLVLTAADGRDVVVTTANGSEEILFDGGDTNAGDITALASQVKTGELTISAQDTINITETGSLANTDTTDDNVQAVGTIANADITTAAAANITMKAVDSALGQIDSFRADLGAIQNRFESTIRNLSAVSESLSAANSRIKDADFAAETAELSKNQVLQQAGISVLAQANALPQQALSLLG